MFPSDPDLTATGALVLCLNKNISIIAITNRSGSQPCGLEHSVGVSANFQESHKFE